MVSAAQVEPFIIVPLILLALALYEVMYCISALARGCPVVGFRVQGFGPEVAGRFCGIPVSIALIPLVASTRTLVFDRERVASSICGGAIRAPAIRGGAMHELSLLCGLSSFSELTPAEETRYDQLISGSAPQCGALRSATPALATLIMVLIVLQVAGVMIIATAVSSNTLPTAENVLAAANVIFISLGTFLPEIVESAYAMSSLSSCAALPLQGWVQEFFLLHTTATASFLAAIALAVVGELVGVARVSVASATRAEPLRKASL